MPEANADGNPVCNQPKEIAMNEAPELKVVDLGDAKDVTMGPPDPQATEEHPEFPQRREG